MVSTLNQKTQFNQEKKAKIDSFRIYHSTLLQDEGVTPTHFYPKMPYTIKSGDTNMKVIGLFESELSKPEGFYVELVDGTFQPMDERRTVYKISHRANFSNIYSQNPKSEAFLIPLEDLEVVERKKMPDMDPKKKITINDLDGPTDENVNNLTIRDLAAILWQKPVSEKKWLNNLINTETNV